MPSPFSQYKGEQIQPINILPYTAQIADTMGKGIAAGIGGIGEAIAKYHQGKAERDELAQTVQGAVSQYVVQDLQNPEDKESYKASDDAPRHSADLINTAIKEGDGDVAKGIAGMPMSKLRAWANLQGKYEKDVQQGIENNFKTKSQEMDAERLRLAAEGQRLENERNQIAAMNSAAEAGIRAWEVGMRAKEFEAKDAERKKVEAQELLKRQVQDVSSIPTSLKVKQQETVLTEVGDIFRPDGTLLASNVELKDGIQALGFKPEDVVTADTAVKAQKLGANYAFDVVGKYLTGNEKFSLAAGFSGAVKEGYVDQFVRNAFKQADAWSMEKTGKGLVGADRFFPQGIDGKIENPSRAFEVAQKIIQDPNFVDYIKQQGVSTVPDGAVFGKAYYTVTGTSKRDMPVEREVELFQIARERMRFEALAKAAGGEDKLPMSWTAYVMSQPDRFLPQAEIQLGDGSRVRVVKMGDKWTTPESVVSNKGALPETKAQLDIISGDKWLRQFEKPTDIGPAVIQFPEGGINSFRGNWEQDYPVLKKGFEDIRLAGEIAAKMRKFAEKGVLEKGLSPQDREEFNQLVMRATTFRKHFIAGGQETEPDAQRLFEQIGALTNVTRLFSSKAHLNAINAFEATIRDQVVSNARNAGFRVAIKNPSQRFNLKEIVNSLESETGVKSTTTKSK